MYLCNMQKHVIKNIQRKRIYLLRYLIGAINLYVNYISRYGLIDTVVSMEIGNCRKVYDLFDISFSPVSLFGEN